MEQREGAVFPGVLAEDFRAHRRVGHAAGAFGDRQMGDCLVGGATGERVLAAGQTEQHADGAGGDDGADRQAVGGGFVGVPEQVSPDFRAGVALRQGEDRGAAAGLDHPAQHGEFGVMIGCPFGHHLQHAGSGVLHPQRDAAQFFFLGAQGRGRVALQRLVRQAAGRGEPESASLHRVSCDLAHLGDVALVGVFEVDGAVAHDEDADGGVRQQRADVDVALPAVEGVEIFAEGFPLPLQAFVHDRAGDVLDAFHQLDQAFAVGGLAGGEADAAIAHDGGGDAMPGGGRHVAVPDRLGVVVGVDVDEAGGDEFAFGVDFFRAAARDRADRGDPVADDADVGLARRAAGAVDDGAASDDQIKCGHWTFSWMIDTDPGAAGAGWQVLGAVADDDYAVDDRVRMERAHVSGVAGTATARLSTAGYGDHPAAASQRANSVSTIDFYGADPEAAIIHAESRYHACGQPARFQTFDETSPPGFPSCCRNEATAGASRRRQCSSALKSPTQSPVSRFGSTHRPIGWLSTWAKSPRTGAGSTR